MSAICGTFGKSAIGSGAEQALGSMLAALRPRGPDGFSRYAEGADRIQFGFAFLRTAPGEASPNVLVSEDRSLIMVCDGHVFNHQVLRPQLRAKGHVFTQPHSCELLLHLYEDEGVAGWRRADGQFGLAIWDARRKRLVLGRDSLGVRSLYYWAGPAGVVFASEIKALLQHPDVPHAVDETAVSDFLTFTSVPGPRTLFRDIHKLAPGTAAIRTHDGAVSLEPYWDLLQNALPESEEAGYYVNRVRGLHEASVARRTVEGPLGALLSGGNDSSANAALLASRVGGLKTFTVGLADLEGTDKYNDLEYARRVSQFIHSEHHERLITTDDFLKTIPLTIDAMDDVVSEPSSVFLYHAFDLAKEERLRVVFTGEANDELSCGHGGMVHIRDGYYRRWQPYMRSPTWLRRAAAAIVPLVSVKHRDILRRAASGDEYFWSYETAWMDTDKRSILAREVTGGLEAGRIVAACKQRFDESAHKDRDYLFYVIYSMMQDFYFTNLMLGKLDLLASSLGIEPRCPYTEAEYAHFVYNIPAQFKTREGLVKYCFKKAIEGILPHEIIYRQKQGFRTPVVELFQGALGRWAEPVLLETGLTREGVLRRDHLEETLRKHQRGDGDYANRLWTAMTLNLWYERWIRGPQSAVIIPPAAEALAPSA